MKVETSVFSKKVIETYKTNLGNLYFFDNLVVSEVDEGAHIDFNSSHELLSKLMHFFGDKPFGYISNRVNKFSISPLDANKFSIALKNLVAYCTVTYSKADTMNAEFEKKFCPKPFVDFSDLESGIKWVKDSLEKNKISVAS